MKWLMATVLPGTDEVLAKPLRCTSILISDDLPTLERPMKAYSGMLSFGKKSKRVLLIKNSAFVMFMAFSCFS